MSILALRGSEKHRGFTLTEAAIVLGIIGLVLGAVWVAASKVYDARRLDTAVKNTSFIVQGYRSLYGPRGVDTANATDITCVGVNSGFFPADMVNTSVACVTGTTSTYPRHPWNNYVEAQSTVQATWQGIDLSYYKLTQTACSELVQQLGNGPDVLQETINGTSVTLPPAGAGTPFTVSQIHTDCVNGTNTVSLVFKVR